MSNLITNGDFASSENTSVNPEDNNWYEFQAGLDNALPTVSEFGNITGMYNIGIQATVTGAVNFINTIYNFDNFDFSYFLLQDKLTAFIYPASYIDEDLPLPTSFNVESSVDNMISLDSSKIYNLSYEVIVSYFNTDYYINDFTMRIELVPSQAGLNTISFDFVGTSFNTTHVKSYQVENPATGNYQVSFRFFMNSAFINGNGRGSMVRQKFEIDNVSLTENLDLIGIPSITDIEGNSNNVINFNLLGNEQIFEVSEDPEDYLVDVCYPLPVGWYYLGITLDLSTIIKGHPFDGGDPNELGADSNGNYDLVDFMKNHVYKTAESTIPLYYENQNEWNDTMIIAKNNSGYAWLPEFNFNGIGNLVQFEGYQFKSGNESTVYLKYSGNIIFDSVNNTTDIQYTTTSGTAQNGNSLANGWNLISHPSLEPVNCVSFFQPFLDAGILLIVKNYNGFTFLPQWNFNGIGNMIPGEAYLFKIQV